MICGIDFGSKLAGTTVLCFATEGQLHFRQSEKRKDADQFLLKLIDQIAPAIVFIDAPLSLPPAYFDKGTDFFYRPCDRELKAMSPMFLGGLTARAMQLKAELGKQNIAVFETYPAQLARLLPSLSPFYLKKTKDIISFTAHFQTLLPYPFAAAPANWHQADAALAWFSAFRYQQQAALAYGEERSGRIWV